MKAIQVGRIPFELSLWYYNKTYPFAEAELHDAPLIGEKLVNGTQGRDVGKL